MALSERERFAYSIFGLFQGETKRSFQKNFKDFIGAVDTTQNLNRLRLVQNNFTEHYCTQHKILQNLFIF